MKKNLSLFVILTTSSYGLAQLSRNNLSFNIGGQMSSTFTKPFYTFAYDEGGLVTKQSSAFFPEFYLMFKQPVKASKISAVIAFGFSYKGYHEIGLDYGSFSNSQHYIKKISNEYIPMNLGIQYCLYHRKDNILSICQVLMPEYYIYWRNSNLKKYAYSTRTTLTASFKSKNKRNFLITSYFQTAIMKYNKSKNHPWSSDYWPYSYGLNFGINLKNKMVK